jgi:hypothetical protein
VKVPSAGMPTAYMQLACLQRVCTVLTFNNLQRHVTHTGSDVECFARHGTSQPDCAAR